MNEKEQAKEFIEKFRKYSFKWYGDPVQKEKIELFEIKGCAMICCDEIIKELKNVETNYDLEDKYPDVCLSRTIIPYWERVKVEIQSL